MKFLTTLILLSFGIMGKCQDSLTAERFLGDSLGNSYVVEYRYKDDDEVDKWLLDTMGVTRKDSLNGINHKHYYAKCSITKFYGNKKILVVGGIQCIYSPTDCPADNSRLWMRRLYMILSKKQ